MSSIYTTQQITDAENGWLLTHNETGKEDVVFADSTRIQQRTLLLAGKCEPATF